MRTPPIAGPTIDAAWKLSWLRAIAAGSRSALTRRGIEADRAGWSIEPTPAATNATTRIAHSGGAPWSASATRARLQAAIPSWVTIRRRRRSTASATAPPPSENTRIGMSWTSVSSPIATTEPVRT